MKEFMFSYCSHVISIEALSLKKAKNLLPYKAEWEFIGEFSLTEISVIEFSTRGGR